MAFHPTFAGQKTIASSSPFFPWFERGDGYFRFGGTVLLDWGRASYESDLPLHAIYGGFGPQSVSLTSPVGFVSLGWGADTLQADYVKKAFMGAGSDAVTLTSGGGMLDLGRGADSLTAEGFVEVIRAGGGKDHLQLEHGAGHVDLGTGSDTIESAAAIGSLDAGAGRDTIIFTEAGALFSEPDAPSEGAAAPRVIDGGQGRDSIEFAEALGDFDFAPIAGGLKLLDRFTGEAVDVIGIETLTFDGRTFTLEELTDLFSGDNPNIFASGGTQNVSVNDPDPSVSVVWNRATIQSVIDTEGFGPTTSSRAYAMVHTAIYDAFAAIDPTALRISPDADGNNAALEAELTPALLASPEALQEAAMSYAAFVVLADLFPGQTDLHESVLEGRYGLSSDDVTSLAARIGRDAAADVLAFRSTDGSNQENGYADTTGYTPVNASPFAISDIARWTPENAPIDPETGAPDQSFLTAHWGTVTGFALTEKAGTPTVASETYLAEALLEVTSLYPDQNPEPEAFFTEAFSDATLNFDLAAGAYTGTITLGSAAIVGGISYAAGDEIAVTRDLIGDVINPDFIAQAEVVLAYSAGLDGSDAGKVSAEFYEDGPGTGFPPGTSMTFAEFLSAERDNTLSEDALLFAAVANAVLDAGIATWEAKTFFDYARPVRVIRDLGELGLIGEEGTDYKGEFGYVVDAYAGPALGTVKVLATEWVTYQTPGGDPSPPFAEYTSGHSAFSAAGAAALRMFNGSDEFGGSVFFPAGSTLFEPGTTPAEDYTIEWETFTEAADEAGLSRLFGGIHFEQGDFHGRALGQYVGENAYDLMLSYFEGTIA